MPWWPAYALAAILMPQAGPLPTIPGLQSLPLALSGAAAEPILRPLVRPPLPIPGLCSPSWVSPRVATEPWWAR